MDVSNDLRNKQKFDKSEFSLGKTILKIKRRENGLIPPPTDSVLKNPNSSSLIPASSKLKKQLKREFENSFGVIKAQEFLDQTSNHHQPRASVLRRNTTILAEKSKRNSFRKYMKTEPSTRVTEENDEEDESNARKTESIANWLIQSREAKEEIFGLLEQHEKEAIRLKWKQDGLNEHNQSKKVEKDERKEHNVKKKLRLSISPEMKQLSDSTDLIRFRRIRKSDYKPTTFSDFVKERSYEKRVKTGPMLKMRNAMKKIKVVARSGEFE